MANYVVWLDSAEAKIFALHSAEVSEKTLRRIEIRHHNGFEKEQNNHKNTDKFFGNVAEALAEANEVLLVGPGEAKGHFKTHLETHHLAKIGSKIVGVETVDHPTDGQIVALAKKFFKSHLQFA